MRTFGLIGKTLSHSFSPAYFQKKFEAAKITDAEYRLFPLANITDFLALKQNNQLAGLNVTIPYKNAIIPYLDELSAEAAAVQAVNTLVFREGRLLGHNTDIIGFGQSLDKAMELALGLEYPSALILGNGGAASAVQYALKNRKIAYQIVSRTAESPNISYEELAAQKLLETRLLIINTTPLGMYPNLETCPDIPYNQLTTKHLLFDLVYNPLETLFLQKGKQAGTYIQNGLEMLSLQAEAAWELWNR